MAQLNRGLRLKPFSLKPCNPFDAANLKLKICKIQELIDGQAKPGNKICLDSTIFFGCEWIVKMQTHWLYLSEISFAKRIPSNKGWMCDISLTLILFLYKLQVSSFASSAQAFFTAFTPAYVKMLERTSDTLRNV